MITTTNIGGYVYGVVEPKPILNVSHGARVRIRMRPKEFASAFIRMNGSTMHYRLIESDYGWMLVPNAKAGCNLTVPARL